MQKKGSEATNFLKEKIEGKKVKIVLERQGFYNRAVSKVYRFRFGLFPSDVGKEMISEGLACVYEGNISSSYKAILKEEEAKAKKQKKGMWKVRNMESPSDFRKRSK